MSLTLSSEKTVTLNGLSDLDACRVAVLAKAFGGRWVPAVKGYSLLPFDHARCVACYNYGFTAKFRLGRWQFRRNDGPWLERYYAVRIAKEAAVSVG